MKIFSENAHLRTVGMGGYYPIALWEFPDSVNLQSDI